MFYSIAMRLSLIFIIYFSSISFSQKNKNVFFELAGSGGFGSFNYEKTFLEKEKINYTWRTGISVTPIDKNNGIVFIFPVTANVLFGKTKHKLELGLGQGISVTTKGSFFTLGLLTAGYRYAHPDKKWFYRITYTPLVSYIFNFQIQQWAGISIGYVINKNK